jgi:hypothetical protein
MPPTKRSLSMSEDEDLKPKLESDGNFQPSTAKSTKKPATGVTRTAWTGEEYNLIFAHVTKHGARDFEGVVPGRNLNQIRKAWV